ncbi:MAG: methyltransferase domain-containing protein [Oligoflexia bacterium]|nr:methyltransferase domain-containing protein [Oligoflexia bacterium]
MWSAAASTGEEPYTIVLTLNGVLPLTKIDFKVLATDISTKVLAIAQKGRYKKNDIQDIPFRYHSSEYFCPVADDSSMIEINPSLKRMVSFCRINLSATPFPMKGPFDAIFCRNVMIYFDERVRTNLLLEIHRLLKVGGYLFIGSSESLAGLSVPFKSIGPSIYQRG